MPQVDISYVGFDNVNDVNSTTSHVVKNVQRGKAEDMAVYVEYENGSETNIQLTGLVRDNEIDVDCEVAAIGDESNTTTLTADGTTRKLFNLLSNEDMFKLKIVATGGSAETMGSVKVGVAQYKD